MKFQVDGQDIFELPLVRKKVICNDIEADIIDDDLKRRVTYVIEHKYERCLERLKREWLPKLKERGQKSIPMDDDELAELIFSQPDYKDKKTRILESENI